MIHVLAIMGVMVAVILWYLIQRHAHGPEGATACGKPRAGSSGCDREWDGVGEGRDGPADRQDSG